MSDPTNVRPFVGFTDTKKVVPAWYRRTNSHVTTSDEVTGLRAAIDALPVEEPRRMAYRDDETGEWVEAENFRVMVNPDWEGDTDDAPMNDAAWYPTTTVYDPITPTAGYQPLADALEAVEGDGYVFGQIREYRHGGKVHGDVFHSALTVDFPDDADAEPWIMGLQFGHDYFQTTSPYCRVIAIDPATGTVHRGLSDRRHRRRSKSRDVPEGQTMSALADWWTEEVERMDAVSDALYSIVFDALNYEITTAAWPVSAHDIMTAAGFPDALADHATSQLPGQGERDTYSAWAYHAAMSSAVTHAFDGVSDGSAERKHVRLANTFLFAPEVAEHDALDTLYDQVAGQSQVTGWESDGIQTSTADVRSEIRDRLENVAQKTDDHRSMKARLRSMIDAAGETDDDTDADQKEIAA